MATLELCYQTARGAGVVRYLRDAESTEKALKALHKRHIEAKLYVSGERDANGNRTEPVGEVIEAPGQTWNGRYVQWNWWFDPSAFGTTHPTHV
jgi:hypothetical protein